MRIQNSFFTVVALALAALTAFGTVYTDQFQQASQSQSVGFDALAHDLFDDIVGPDQSQGQSK
jgi:hypothetical protein